MDLSVQVVTDSGTTEKTPVFLRFINMIINDAIVQLDEGLEVNFNGNVAKCTQPITK